MSDVRAGVAIVVCGGGRVGSRVARLLARAGAAVALVDPQSPPPPGPGVRVVAGDARDVATLLSAGADRAETVVAATDDDLVNLSVALEARALRPDVRLVVRIFDGELAASLRRTLPDARILSASELAAPALAAATLGATPDGSVETPGGALLVAADPTGATEAARRAAGLAPLPGAPGRLLGSIRAWRTLLDGRPRRAAPAAPPPGTEGSVWRRSWRSAPPALRLLLAVLLGVAAVSVAIFSWGLGIPIVDAFYFVMATVTTVGYGDINLLAASPGLKIYGTVLMLVGATLLASLTGWVSSILFTARFEEALGRGASDAVDHVIVIGLTHPGFRAARKLEAAGVEVVAVAPDGAAPLAQELRAHAVVLTGDPRSAAVLHRAGLARARAILAATDDDLANVAVALLAEGIRPGIRTVVRLFDDRLAARLPEGLRIDAALSTSSLAAATFAAAALDPAASGCVIGEELHLLGGAEGDPLEIDGRTLTHRRISLGRPRART